MGTSLYNYRDRFLFDSCTHRALGCTRNLAYGDSWTGREIPLVEMRARIIPEGVLQQGGNISGFLYFEHIRPEIENVFFRAELVDATNGRFFGLVSFPFEVSAQDTSAQ